MTPGAPDPVNWRAHNTTNMKYIDAIEAILDCDLNTNNAGVLVTSTIPNHDCTIAFGVCLIVIPPMEEITYFYEKRPLGCVPTIGIPDAILYTPAGDERQVIYLYMLEE